MSSRLRGRVAAVSGGLLALAFAAWVVGGADVPGRHHAGWDALADPTHAGGPAFVQALGLLLAALIAGAPIASSALRSLRFRAFSIDLLVMVAVTGALVIGEFTEAGVVAFLFVVGAWLEARSLERTRRSVGDLLERAPTTAEVRRDGEVVTTPVDDVVAGDVVVLRAGSTVPVDGVVVTGSGHLDEAMITGEPVPARRSEGDEVFSGTVVTDGFLDVRADQVGESTTFARIVELVEEAQDRQGPTQRFLDRFSRSYTPAVLLASLAAFLVTRDLHLALTFLVIACPGALVISAPVAMVAGIGNGARHGVLLKGGDAVERLAAVDVLVVDKTGTLTHGRPRVVEVVTAPGRDRLDVLAAAGSVESASEHPLGRAVLQAAQESGVPLTEPVDVRVTAGEGIGARVDGRRVDVGSQRMLTRLDLSLPEHLADHMEDLERRGATVAVVVEDGARIAGLLAVADEVRPDVVRALQDLRDQGVQRIVMLTGDNPRTAEAVARVVGVDEVHAGLLPQDKAEIVDRLTAQGHRVAMIGDGINDAPAIARAHVGIAMGTGTDVSMEAADAVLAGGRFDQLVHARRLARATVRTVRQNTVLALVTVVGLLAGVLTGTVLMGLGMLVHEASVLLVVLNAVRLTRFGGTARPPRDDTTPGSRGADRTSRPAVLPA